MFVFKRHKKKDVALENKHPHVLFQQCEKMKQMFACYLQQLSELLSLKSKKVILLLFFIVCSAGSVFIIVNASGNRNKIIHVKQISKPSSIQDSTHIATKSDSAITEKDYKRIELFKSYLLQLRDDSINRKRFDSIIVQRPHLIDSIALFEKMYLSQ